MPEDVTKHGATGDGLRDDGPALRAAADAAVRGDGVVEVPLGRYAIGTDGGGFLCWDLPGGITVRGSGTLAYLPGARRSARLVGIGTRGVRLERLALDLVDAPEGTSFGVSVRDGAEGVSLVDLDVRGNPYRGGVQLLGGVDTTLLGCRITDVAQNGVTLYGKGVGKGPRGVRISSCHIAAEVQPVDCEPVDGATCEGLVVEDCCLATTDNYALTLSGSRSARVSSCTLYGSLYLTAAEGASIEGCLVDARDATSRNAVEGAVGSRDCRIEGSTVLAAPGRLGIRVATSRGRTSGGWTVRENTIVVDRADPAAVLLDHVDGVRIVDNDISGTATDGAVRERGTPSGEGNVISGNRIAVSAP